VQTLLEQEGIRQRLARLTPDEYHRLGELGVLSERTELIDGLVLNKMPKSPRHRHAVQRLFDLLLVTFPGWHVRKEDPLTLGTSEPEPDLAVVAGHSDDYREAHPTAAVLVVEVSLSSHDLDFAKQYIYARAGIPEYWLLDLERRELTRFYEPQDGQYLQTKTLGETEQVALGKRMVVVGDLLS